MSLFTRQTVDVRKAFYVRVCSSSSRVTSGHRTFLKIESNVCTKSASASNFGLVLLGTLSYAPLCSIAQRHRNFLETLQTGLIKNVFVSQNLWFQHDQASNALSARFPAVVEREICKKVEWKWQVKYVTPSVAGFKHDSFLWGTWRSAFPKSLARTIEELVLRFQRNVTTYSSVFKKIPRVALPSALKWTEDNSKTTVKTRRQWFHCWMTYAIWRVTRISRTKRLSGHMFSNIFDLLSYKHIQNGKLVYKFIFTLYIKKHSTGLTSRPYIPIYYYVLIFSIVVIN